jgi:Carboxypeptidase regulatory-like domain
MNRILASLALGACLSGCARDQTATPLPSSPSQPTPTPATYSVSGTVTSTAGDRIPGATVSVTGAATMSNATTTTTTDVSGRYVLTGLAAAEYSMSADAKGYAAASRSVSLSGSPTFVVDFALAPVDSGPPAAITFANVGADKSPVADYAEAGFRVVATTASWIAIRTYGHPAPFVQFLSPGGVTTTGEIQLTASGAPFSFKSVDLYSSTTRIPYVITGLRKGATVFTLSNTLGNTFGNFATVVNPQSTALIDALSIQLTNAAAPCCDNPIGIDNISVSR